MSEQKEEAKELSTTEILANALAESNKEANSSNKNTVRVLGTLLAFSVLGNFALAGLNISGNFFGTDIKMGGADVREGAPAAMMESEEPPEEWCAEMEVEGALHDDDLYLCEALYPHLFHEDD